MLKIKRGDKSKGKDAISGALRDYMRELANEPEDLTDEKTEEQVEENVLTFSWHGDEKHYILDYH